MKLKNTFLFFFILLVFNSYSQTTVVLKKETTTFELYDLLKIVNSYHSFIPASHEVQNMYFVSNGEMQLHETIIKKDVSPDNSNITEIVVFDKSLIKFFIKEKDNFMFGTSSVYLGVCYTTIFITKDGKNISVNYINGKKQIN